MMRKLIGLGILHVVVAVLILGGQTSVNAVGGASAALTGCGTISPGLTAVPTAQSGTFSGALTGSGGLVRGSAPNFHATAGAACNFSFQGVETVSNGAGRAQGACAGGSQVLSSASVSCDSLSYTRVAALVLVTGTCNGTVNGNTVPGSLVAVLVFVSTSAPGAPTTSYSLVGTAAAAATQ